MDDAKLRQEGMTTEETQKILQFQDLTGIEDMSVCQDVLQRHSWNLEGAVYDQLNIREGRPSVFAVNARTPTVVVDNMALMHFSPLPRDGGTGGGIIGLFRYVVHLVWNWCYSTVSSVLNIALRIIRPDPRLALTDPVGDVMAFVNSFDEKYSDQHPVFYRGTYAQAVNDAKQELRFLLLFLHHEKYPDSEEFSRTTLADPNVINLVNQHMLFWACNVKTGEGYRVCQALKGRNFPFLAIIVVRDGRMTVVARMEGMVEGPELTSRLRLVIRENEACIVAARVDRMERNFNQSLRAQQDAAYQQSLLADQEKERGRKEERQRAQQLEDDRRRQELEEERRRQDIQRQKMELLDNIPREPNESDFDTVHLSIKLPSGLRLERRFLKTHSLQDVHNFVFCHPEAPDCFEIATNFPKRVLDSQSQDTLEKAGIKQREVLFVHDLDA